jgi:mevalonate kinase
MIVVLGIPLILVNLLSLGKNVSFEGFETTDDKDKTKEIINKINEKAQDAKSNLGTQTPLEPTMDTSNSPDNSESFEAGRRKNRNTNSKIDYASTIEEAYDNLNSILGSDGINRLTKDSQRLMKQQADLAESMKAMGPLMEQMGPMLNQAKDMMSSMNDGKSGLGSVMGIANQLQQQLSGISNKK